MSCDGGNKVFELSTDHKPLNKLEYNRIYEAGGSVY